MPVQSPNIGPDRDRTFTLRLTLQGQHIGLVQANSRFYQRPHGRAGPLIGVGWKRSGRSPVCGCLLRRPLPEGALVGRELDCLSQWK